MTIATKEPSWAEEAVNDNRATLPEIIEVLATLLEDYNSVCGRLEDYIEAHVGAEDEGVDLMVVELQPQCQEFVSYYDRIYSVRSGLERVQGLIKDGAQTVLYEVE